MIFNYDNLVHKSMYFYKNNIIWSLIFSECDISDYGPLLCCCTFFNTIFESHFFLPLKEEKNTFDLLKKAKNKTIQASKIGRLDWYKLLLKKRKEEDKCFFKKQANIDHSMTASCKRGHINMVRFLIKYVLTKSIDVASKYGHLDIVKFLINNGAHDFENGLRNASIGGQLHIVKFLSETKRVRNSHAATDAAQHGHLHIVKYLIETIKSYSHLNLLLAWTIVGGEFLDVVKYLIENGADDFEDAINMAARYGRLSIVQLLIERHNIDNLCISKAHEISINFQQTHIIQFFENLNYQNNAL